MDLSAFDDQCVRITLRDGSVFEGACQYNSAEYNMAEIGTDEDGLEISNWLFCAGDIETIELINENDTFLSSFGTIELEAVHDGADETEDILLDGDPRNAARLLNCIEKCLDDPEYDVLFDRRIIKTVLEHTVQYSEDDDIRQRCENLLKQYFGLR